jgi:hypothetical protein
MTRERCPSFARLCGWLNLDNKGAALELARE